jgi:membrane protease subunit (stomatin/prohibitin family)
MAIWDAIKNQFIEVIEWTEPSNEILACRFPVANREIKWGAQLIVRESQSALFVNEGQPADAFEPGRHTLETENLPIISKLEAWPFGFNSPFKAEVYFYSLRQKLGQKWGTRQPITLRDPELGSVQLRMFGVCSYHIADVRTFYREISGTREVFTTDDLVSQLLPTIVSGASTTFAQAKLPFLDMAANLPQLSQALSALLAAPLSGLGLALDSFVVESVTLPEALQAALHARQSMAIVGDLQSFTQYQTAKAIPDAANNPSGVAGVGAGLGAGLGIAQAMGRALGGANSPQPAAATPALVACGACGRGIETGSAFCRFCGSSQQLNCPSCNKAVAPGSTFCAGCGTKLSP